MPLIDVKVKHGRTHAEARDRLATAVAELQSRFGGMVPSTEWSPGRDSVVVTGPGVRLDLRVDAEDVHVTGDIPILGSLFGSANLKQLVETTFQKPSK